MQALPTLSAAIEGLYLTFSGYPLPQFTEPCLHCHTLEEEALLHSLPLRKLRIAELQDYAWHALTTWGGAAEFKHFLPRIFELYFAIDEPTFEFLDLFSKLRHGRWLGWPAPEQTAVRNFLHALWAEILGDPPSTSSFTDIQCWLCSIAQAEDNLQSYFAQWIEDQRESSSFALSSMLLSDAGRNPFWDRREEQYKQLQDWKRSPAVTGKLQRARDLASDDTVRNEFEAALGSIGFMGL